MLEEGAAKSSMDPPLNFASTSATKQSPFFLSKPMMKRVANTKQGQERRDRGLILQVKDKSLSLSHEKQLPPSNKQVFFSLCHQSK
jgi:hypothetical protein